MHIKEGYCEECSQITTVRVWDIRECSNKAKYKVIHDGHTINVCGTHLRNYYQRGWDDKPIKGKWLKNVEYVEELKTGKIIYQKIANN